MSVASEIHVPGVGARVELAAHEVEMAAQVGLRRQLQAMRAGRPDRHGIDPDDGWRAHIEGACGELAVAKFLRRYWDGSVDTFRTSPDVAGVEVRTRSRFRYDLLVRPDDDPAKVYIHVTGRAPLFVVWGWIHGHAARRDEWWQTHGDRPGAWFVPRESLRVDWP